MPKRFTTKEVKDLFADYGYIVPNDFVYRNSKQNIRVYDEMNDRHINLSVQKLKFNIASLETKIEKDYVVLGKLFYNLIEDGGEVSDDAKEIAETIKVKYAEIEKLKKEINDIKQD